MADNIEILKRIYDRFNARDIDGVLAVLADDVAWANGMDGGHVHGLRPVALITCGNDAGSAPRHSDYESLMTSG
jgi:hypothetical protein